MMEPKRERPRAARIAYYVHGRGRGHAARSLAVLARLEAEGHDIRVFGSGHAVRLLGARADFERVRLTAPGTDLVRSILARLPEDARRLRALRPDIVICDSDLSSVHVARALGIPSIALGHGLLFRHCRLPASLPRWGAIRESVSSGSSSWPAWRKIAVHFGDLPLRTRDAVLARPDLREGLAASTTDGGFVLTYFRDDNGYRVLDELVRRGETVVNFGGADVPRGVVRHPTCADAFAAHLVRCRAVVASAGNHLPAECGMLGKPMLGVYERGDVEQAMNGTLVDEAGLGLAAPLSDVTPDLLDRFFAARLPKPGAAARLWSLPPASEVVARLVAERLGVSEDAGTDRAL